MLNLFTSIEFHTSLMLIFVLIFVLFYEAINGFHDTANAVATVIYSRALCSQLAVLMSGIFNFFGVLMGGLSVAYAIVHLLPINILLNISSTHSLAMMFTMLLAAIMWNIGTWYFGLPASSSHTLISAIIGIGLINAFNKNNSLLQALNISKLIEIFLSLILSPILGLALAAIMIFFFRRYCNSNQNHRCIHLTPLAREKLYGKYKPPFWIRIALIFSAAGVSFSHGANDGQKGIGLIMLLLIGVYPAIFVVNINANSYEISRTYNAIHNLKHYYTQFQINEKQVSLTKETNNITNEINFFNYELSNILLTINQTSLLLVNLKSYENLNLENRCYLRHLLTYIADVIDQTVKLSKISTTDKKLLINLRKDLLYTIEYAPTWIIIAVALSLSLGTMIGWRRVVITIGEKIGKTELTYAQGLSAQITAAISIGVASYTGMPVSTTHVLSSAVAGTMLIDGSGLHSKTVKNILMVWILTLPGVIVLAATLYWLALQII